MAKEVRSVVLKRSELRGFGFSILGGSGSDLPPIVYDIVDDSPASASGQLEAGDVILEVNNRQVSDLTTKEVLKCLRLSQRSVSLKLQRDDVIKERVRQYLESPNTLESLRPAITQRDLTHVRDVVAMKSPQRVPRVPVAHSPPKGRAKPLPPPGALESPVLQPPGAPEPPVSETNGHGRQEMERPRFETFTMTGDVMLNLSRTPAGEKRRAAGGGSAPGSPQGGGGGGFRGSRSEDRLLAPADTQPDAAEDTAGSVDPLLDTGPERPELSPERPEIPPERPELSLEGPERHPERPESPPDGPDQVDIPPQESAGGPPLTASAPASPPAVNGETALSPAAVGGLSPDSEDGSDCESLDSDCGSLQGFRLAQKAVDLPSAVRLAKRLFLLEGFRKADVSRHLSKNNEFSRTVAEEYVKYFDFTKLTLDAALGQFLERFALTGETQERERVLVHFSKRYMDNNPGAFNSPDACHTLTCALMLLNTDLHVQHVPRKMTCAEFVDNLAELNDGEDFPADTLRRLYQAIREKPLHYATDDEYEEMQAAPPAATDLPPSGAGTNPFLAAPDPSKATEYKRGYMMRKCCVDPNGKKTALGRRSWQMFHCTLRDLVLYLHKDESGSRRQAAFDHLHNAIRVHHALASKAEDYFKKQHVFKLETADQAQYLLQTSDAKELQSWVDTINFTAAALSSPPLPGAVGSQRRFQRPLLPAGVTAHSLHDQLSGHETRLSEIEQQLAELEAADVTGGKQGRLGHYQRHKAAFLRTEAVRYRTYSQLLRSKMAAASPPPPVATPAPLPADTAVTVPPAAERGRPVRPTDRYSYQQAVRAGLD